MSDFKGLEIELADIVDEHQERLKGSDVSDIQEYIDHGEYGLAFELFCACLKNAGSKINESHLDRLRFLAHRMEILSSDDWVALESYVLGDKGNG